MLIRLSIEGTEPLAGSAATEGGDPLHFDGWLELLRVVSELVAAAGSQQPFGWWSLFEDPDGNRFALAPRGQ